MLDLLVFGIGVVVAPGARLVLVRLRCGRWREPPVPNQYLPPPAGHQAVVDAGGCTLRCSCGWWYRVPWPPTSRRLNGARGNHYSAVEQQRLAERLGVDAESMLARVLTAQGVARQARQAQQAQQAARREPGEGAAQIGAGYLGSRPEPRLEPARNARKAAEARRASAIARVESGRVLPKYTGGGG